MPNSRWTHDRMLCKDKGGVVGVDEAGRGCLAGPVVAGCVILPAVFFTDSGNRKITEEINDSKQFNEGKREDLFRRIQRLIDRSKIYGAIGCASVDEIEERNIVGATCLAMARAMESASARSRGIWSPLIIEEDLFAREDRVKTEWAVLVDGRPMKKLVYQHLGLVKGDTISLAVAMSSILAKVSRDQWMKKLAMEFPDYGFASNKGYGTPVHLKALNKYGITKHHRPRFLRSLLANGHSKNPGKPEQSRLSLI